MKLSTNKRQSQLSLSIGPAMWLLGSLALCGLLATRMTAAELSAEEKAAGFVSMFNGTDLTGWRFDEGDSPPQVLPENWKVENGTFVVTGGGKPNITTVKSYKDFEMRFEWRATKPKYNSGFFVRSGKRAGANQINLAAGAEGKFIGGKLQGDKAVPELQKPAGEWNEWRVKAEGSNLTFWCNGKLAWEATSFQTLEGHIGFQAEGARIEFRNLRIREITQ